MSATTNHAIRASVIICAYTQERWEDLKAAVTSIQHQETSAGEIILVIDHNAELLEMARDQFPSITVLENHGPRGLSGARNTGVEFAGKEVVAFMDEDAVAQPDWLTQLLMGYQDEHVMGVGGLVEPNWLGERPAWFPDEFTWVVGCSYKGLPKTMAQVRNMLGCNMSFRREVFATAGGFLPGLGRVGSQLPLSCEETEFCIRLNRRFPQSRFWYIPQARVRHSVPASRVTWQYFRARCYAEGLSKAMVAGFVGAGQGLATERKYTTRTLPLGILHGIGDAFLKGDLAGLLRASAIVAGLEITVAGYLSGTISARLRPASTSSLKPTHRGYPPG
jgi:GT2 family glycosyltransferase